MIFWFYSCFIYYLTLLLKWKHRMSYFSNLLSAFSRRMRINSPQIAMYCGLDRVTVYRFMTGKTLPRRMETVFNIAELLQLTEIETNQLIEAYKYTRLGPCVYLEREYIQNFMRSFTGTSPMIPLIQYETEDLQDPETDTLLVSNRNHFLKRLQKEILRACPEAPYSIRLVMHPGIDPVMGMLLSAGKKSSSLTIRHIIPQAPSFMSSPGQSISTLNSRLLKKDSSCSGITGMLSSQQQVYSLSEENKARTIPFQITEKKQQDQNQQWNYELLQSFFRIVSMSSEKFNYEPSYFYSMHTEDGSFPMYSNLLITKRAAVLFTDDLCDSVFFWDQTHINILSRKFDQIFGGQPALAYVFRADESFINNIDKVIVKRSTGNVEYHYSSLPCTIPVLAKEIISNHLKKSVLPQANEDRRRTLESICKFLGAYQEENQKPVHNQINFLSESGIRYFLKTGRFANIPPELYTPLSEKERRQLLLNLAKSPNSRIQILKKELSAPEGMLSLEVMNNSLLLGFLAPGKGMCFFCVNEPGLVIAFRNFFEGFSREELYSDAESREILRRISLEVF